uniref:Uncharacterized protein n=1 Tax=Mola mola TaxID=94237 RepID=A0A3Q4BKC6_MOLML
MLRAASRTGMFRGYITLDFSFTHLLPPSLRLAGQMSKGYKGKTALEPTET